MASVKTKITGVSQSGKLFEIEIDDAANNPLKTAIQEKAHEAMALKESGQTVLVDFTPKPGNRRNDGSFWPETRWYERAVPAEEEKQASLPEIPQKIGFQNQMPPEDAWRIAKSTGAKLAVDTIPHLPEAERNDPAAQQRVALFWAHFIYDTPHDPDDVPFGDDIPY